MIKNTKVKICIIVVLMTQALISYGESNHIKGVESLSPELRVLLTGQLKVRYRPPPLYFKDCLTTISTGNSTNISIFK